MEDEEATKGSPGALPFALLFAALSLFLLSQIGSEAKFSAGGPLVAQPAFWPAIGLAGMSVFGGLQLLGELRSRRPEKSGSTDLSEIGIWLRSLEYLFWFMAYVAAVPVIGYLPATLAFTALLAFRAGYRDPWMLGAALLSGFVIVLVFKTMLSVKIPGGALYDHLPATLRTPAMLYF